MDDDLKIILVIIGLWIVQSVLAIGPLRSELEIMLILSLVPYVDFIISIGNLVSSTEPGSLLFYIQFIIILLKDALITYIYQKYRK